MDSRKYLNLLMAGLIIQGSMGFAEESEEVTTTHTLVNFRTSPGIAPGTSMGHVETHETLKVLGMRELSDHRTWLKVEAPFVKNKTNEPSVGWVASEFFTEARTCEGGCGSKGQHKDPTLQKIPIPAPAPVPAPVPRPKAPEKTKPSEPTKISKSAMSCAQKELLKAAKRYAPNRPWSKGLCGPYVQNIIAGAERANPGFDRPPLPQGNRYPPSFIKWLRDRGWTQLQIKNENEAPPGAVIIFRGIHNPSSYRRGFAHPGDWVGHITVKGDDGLWYTDARQSRPHARNRFFQAAFIPGPNQIKACAK